VLLKRKKQGGFGWNVGQLQEQCCGRVNVVRCRVLTVFLGDTRSQSRLSIRFRVRKLPSFQDSNNSKSALNDGRDYSIRLSLQTSVEE
jgi:hypothetical protein